MRNIYIFGDPSAFCELCLKAMLNFLHFKRLEPYLLHVYLDSEVLRYHTYLSNYDSFSQCMTYPGVAFKPLVPEQFL